MNETFGSQQRPVFGETEHLGGSSGRLGIRHPSRTDCHGGHCDLVRTFDGHHVVEQSEGGATVPENLAIVCPNTHRNTHDLYAEYDEYNGVLPPGVRDGYSRISRRMAKARWEAKTAGKTAPLNQDWRLD